MPNFVKRNIIFQIIVILKNINFDIPKINYINVLEKDISNHCSECEIKTKEWLNAPYEEPKVEIDWEKVPENTPVYISDYNEHPTDTSLHRHFSAYFKDSVCPFEVWAEGKTSFTTVEVNSYKYCSLARKEDIEKYRKV